MTARSKFKQIFLILIALFIGLIVLIVFVGIFNQSLSESLSRTSRVNADILLVEGWLPQYAIEMAYKEFKEHGYTQIVTTGLRTPDFFMMSMNGYLVFHPKRLLAASSDISEHTIEVEAYGQLGGRNAALFKIFVNDTLLGNFEADKKKKKYLVKWKGDLASLDSVIVNFTNDKRGDFGDRNLFVKEIWIDHKTIIPSRNYSEYDIGALDGKDRIKNNFNSYAELARNSLLSMGIDSAKVIAIPGKNVAINRTLSSVLAFREWLKRSGLKSKGINVISLGAHARRTWMTYNKVLHDSYRVGIISLPDYNTNQLWRRRFLKTFRETVALAYYWLVLLPY
jgi:hypothetical protein